MGRGTEYRTRLFVGGLLTICNATFILVAISGNGWVYSSSTTESPTLRAHIGLWNTCFDNVVRRCLGNTQLSYGQPLQPFWKATEAFMLMGTIAACVGLLTCLIAVCIYNRQRPVRGLKTATTISLFFSWFCAMVAAAIWKANWTSAFSDTTHLTLDWAYAFAWVSFAWGFIVWILFINWVVDYGERD